MLSKKLIPICLACGYLSYLASQVTFLMEELYSMAYAFCQRMCQQQGIDQSHDQTHMDRVARIALRLNQLCGRQIEQREQTVMILSAFTHDLCDHKYTEVSTSLSNIKRWLESLPIDREMFTGIIKIITTMSYSIVSHLGYPSDLGCWETAYHHVRIADLIDAYDVNRCFQYKTHLNPELSETERWKLVVDIFEKRVLTQLDMYIKPVCSYAVILAQPEHDHALQEIKKLKFQS
jgi:hypothetical protein